MSCDKRKQTIKAFFRYSESFNWCFVHIIINIHSKTFVVVLAIRRLHRKGSNQAKTSFPDHDLHDHDLHDHNSHEESV